MTDPESLEFQAENGGMYQVVPEIRDTPVGPSTKQKIGRVLLATAVAGTFGFAGKAYSSTREECVGASSETIATVQSDLNKAANSDIISPTITVTIDGQIQTSTFDFADSQAVFHRPLIDFKNNFTLSGEELLTAAEDLGKSYGVVVSLLTSVDSQKLDMPDAKSFASSELDSLTTKGSLRSFIDGLSSLPQSYVKASDVQHIYIASDLPDLSGVTFRTGSYETVIVNLGVPFDKTTVGHELTHGFDQGYCGSVALQYRDPSYSNYNGQDVYTENIDDVTRLPISESALLLPNARGSAYVHSKSVNYGRIVTIMKKIMMVSDYSYTNVAEDKAELGATELYDVTKGMIFSGLMPRLRNKAIEFLARVYMKDRATYDMIVSNYMQDEAHTQRNTQSIQG